MTENECCTPSGIIEMARKTMGSIDLDPASCEAANEAVKATVFYTKKTNGLRHFWRGNVFMNPPYERKTIANFVKKLVGHVKSGEVGQAVVLVNNCTETRWGQLLLKNASSICFPSKRIKFLSETKNKKYIKGQMIVYFGGNVELFYTQFSKIGVVYHGRI